MKYTRGKRQEGKENHNLKKTIEKFKKTQQLRIIVYRTNRTTVALHIASYIF